MKIVLYIVIIAASLLIPLEKADVAKLQPVEVAAIRVHEDKTEIITDTGAWGEGENAQEALDDLVLNTPGIVYLDTAKYLMVDERSLEQVELLRDELKGNVKLCLWNGEGKLQDAVKYFSVHEEIPKLKTWEQGEKLPQYLSENG